MLQVFHCLRHDGSGGDTLLVDGFHAAETVRHEDPHAFTDLAQFRVEHEYKGTFSKMTNFYSESQCLNKQFSLGVNMNKYE